MASYILPHYIGQWRGNRFSIVHFNHQVCVDYAQEKKGTEQIFPFDLMPEWYKARDKNL